MPSSQNAVSALCIVSPTSVSDGVEIYSEKFIKHEKVNAEVSDEVAKSTTEFYFEDGKKRKVVGTAMLLNVVDYVGAALVVTQEELADLLEVVLSDFQLLNDRFLDLLLECRPAPPLQRLDSPAHFGNHFLKDTHLPLRGSLHCQELLRRQLHQRRSGRRG